MTGLLQPFLDQPLFAAVPLWVLRDLPVLVFVFCLGACVGSFTNVVVFRLPAGMSVISPPSRCPVCGVRLRFFRENLPIIGWFMIGGKCRACRVRVSPQYMLVEVMMAVVFAGTYALLFMTDRYSPWWLQIGSPWWTWNTVFRAWPAYLAVCVLLAGLVAMTLIDARTFTIPLEIPVFVTVAAFVLYPLQSLLPHRARPPHDWPIPGVGWVAFGVAVGGMLGIFLAMLLLRAGRLKRSFEDYDDYVEDGQVLGDYPHARREMKHELAFLFPCAVGLVAGGFFGRFGIGVPPDLLQAIGASLLGYLVGGGLVWGIRIFGTLVFGREAMGLGDVHLLGAIGAVLGWYDPIIIFFLAPFSGIMWVLVSAGASSILRMRWRELPYGPHLAVATLIVIFMRPGLNRLYAAAFPTVPLPRGGLVHDRPIPAPPVRRTGPQRAPSGPPARQPSPSNATPRPSADNLPTSPGMDPGKGGAG